MSESKSSDNRIDAIIADYLKSVAAGSSPDRAVLLAQHVDLADELRSFFADHDRMHRFVEPPTIGPAPVESAPLGCVRYFGDYELLEEIARGGMGVVYKARQVSLNRVVALKMILAGQLASADDVRRFRTEAEAAANLDHPNILPIYEVGEHEGQHYFSMKYVEGGNLAGWLKDRNADSAEKKQSLSSSAKSAVQILIAVSRAVHYAHQRGILHRDLKPGNILLDADGTPFVADFGLAKRIEGDATVTHSGALVGTPSYMAPEQARAEKQLTTAIDVYAIGAILYESLTGRPPFHGPNAIDTVMLVLEREPDQPHKSNPTVDRDLATIAMKCLEKDPAKRYGSAEALADELEHWQRGEPIQARPVSRVERAWRWAKRKPMTAGLAAAVVFLLLGGTAGMAVLYAKAERRRVEAISDRALAMEREQAARRSWYSADISLAARAWDTGSTPRVLQLLEQHLPQPGESDLRGFEWHYLWRATHAAKETKQLGTGVQCNWRLLANGRYAARTVNKSAQIEVWNVETAQRRELQGQFILGEWSTKDAANRWALATGEITVVKPEATATKNKEREGELLIRTFDLESAREVADMRRVALKNRQGFPMPGLERDNGFALATDGRTLVETTFLPPDFTPDGSASFLKLIFNPMFQIQARFLDVAEGQAKKFAAPGMLRSNLDASPTFSDMAIRSDGGSLALVAIDMPKSGATLALRQYAASDPAAGMKTSIFRFDETKGFTAAWPVSQRPGGAYAVAFSPEGNELIVAEYDHAIRILDARSGQEMGALRGHTGTIRCFAFSSDGALLATAGEDLTIRLWDRKTHRAVGVFSGHLEQVSGLGFTTDGNTLVSMDRRGTVKHWQRSSPPGPRVHSMPRLRPIVGMSVSIAFAGDGSQMLVDRPNMPNMGMGMPNMGMGRNIEESKVIIDIATGHRLTDRKLPKGRVGAIARSGSEEWTLLVDGFVSQTKLARIWNTATDAVREVPPTAEGFFLMQGALAPDGRFVAGLQLDISDQSMFVIVRPLEGTQVRELFRRKELFFPQFFDFSADGRQLLFLSKELGFRTWDVESGEAGLCAPLPVVPVGQASLSGDGTGIYFATENRQICRCNTSTGKVTVISAGSIDRPTKVLASSDDRRLFVLSGVEGSPWSIVVWDLQAGRELITLPVPAPSVNTIVLSPDGTKLAADTPEAVIVWDATPLGRTP